MSYYCKVCKYLILKPTKDKKLKPACGVNNLHLEYIDYMNGVGWKCYHVRFEIDEGYYA